jgi:hypothetical protein
MKETGVERLWRGDALGAGQGVVQRAEVRPGLSPLPSSSGTRRRCGHVLGGIHVPRRPGGAPKLPGSNQGVPSGGGEGTRFFWGSNGRFMHVPGQRRSYEQSCFPVSRWQGSSIFVNRVKRIDRVKQGTAQNWAEAFKLYRQAAERGIAMSMHHLGYMFEHGLGVPRNPAESAQVSPPPPATSSSQCCSLTRLGRAVAAALRDGL